MSFLGSLFASSPPHQLPQFTGLQIQTAVNVVPIPIVYGAPRTVGNIIYSNGFRAVEQKQGGKGGKGLLTGGKNTGTGQYKYFDTFILALAEGGTSSIIGVFLDSAVYDDISALPNASNITYFQGGVGQTPWTYLLSEYPSDAFNYPFTAYLGFADYEIDASATIPQFSFILKGLFSDTFPLNHDIAIGDTGRYFYDADPARCIYDLLTNTRYGVMFPEESIDETTLNTSDDGFNPDVGDMAISTYCQAVGMGFAVSLNNSEPASSIIDRWCQILTVAMVWTGNILKFIPRYDSYSGDNPGWDAAAGIAKKYYRPSIDVLFNLTDNDFIQTHGEDDPVVISRIDPADAKNVVRFNFKDRFNQWNDNVAEAKDDNQVELYGPRVENITSSQEFSRVEYAIVGAQLRLSRNVAIRNTYTFKVGWQWCILDPMDVITITDATLGVNKLIVRIISIEEGDDFLLTIVAEEFPIGAEQVHNSGNQPNTPTNQPSNVIPDPVNVPFIFEPTASMLNVLGETSPVVVIGVSGGAGGFADPNWGGADAYVSTDDVTYAFQATKRGASRMGYSTALLNSFGGTNPDTTNTLSVDLRESKGDLVTVTSSQAAAGITLCAIQDVAGGNLELLAYETATLTGPNQYNLTNLWRGLYGTPASSHISGSQFLRLDGNELHLPLLQSFVGVPLYLKLTSFNIYNLVHQDISTATAYPYTPTGVGVPMTAFSGNISGKPGAGAIVYQVVFGGNFLFKAGLPSSVGYADTVSTATKSFAINKNGTNIGSMDFAIGAHTPTFTFLSNVTVASGDILALVAPGVQDATLANVSWTFLALAQ